MWVPVPVVISAAFYWEPDADNAKHVLDDPHEILAQYSRCARELQRLVYM